MARPADSDGIATGRLRRVVPAAELVARTAGESVVDRLRRKDPDPETLVRRADRYVELLGRSKGALMKVGQLMSFVTLSTAVPDESRATFQAAMGRLQAEAPPMAFELAAEMIRADLGERPEVLFEEFDPVPLAAASIGQVHAATTRDGQRVAVKVQYPGVAAAIEADLKNTELLAVLFQLMRSFVPGAHFDMRSMAVEITARVSEELDYVNEARNQMFFADAYAHHPFFRIPRVRPEYSSRHVLTQEFATGLRWADALGADKHLRDSWAEVLYRFYFGSLRMLGAFYADPHPGNYFFHEDGTVTFLDFGCVKYFPPERVALLTDVIKAVVSNDRAALRQAFVAQGAFDDTTGPSADEIAEWYAGPLLFFHDPQPVTLSTERLAEAIRTQYSPFGSSGTVVRRLRTPGDLVFLSRIDLGLISLMAELEATNDWLAVGMEMDFDAPPATELGRRHARWVQTAPTRSR